MRLFTPEGNMSTGLRRTLVAGAAIVAIAGVAELVHHYSGNDGDPACEAQYGCGDAPLDPRTGEETDTSSMDKAPDYADDTTPEDDQDATPEPETTTKASNQTNDNASTDDKPKIAFRTKLSADTCNYWGTSRHQDIQFLDQNHELQPFVRVDSRSDGQCNTENHGATLYSAASTHSARVMLGNTATTYGYKVLDGTLVAITGVECGDVQKSTTPDGEVMEAAAWVDVAVPDGANVAYGKIPVKNVGYIDTSVLRNHAGFTQKHRPAVGTYYDGC